MSPEAARASALYAVEHRVLDPVSRVLGDVRAARAAAERIVDHDRVAARWPGLPVPSIARRGSGATTSLACRTAAGDDHVLLAERTLAALLHELAHLAVGPAAGHDDRFAAALCCLVRWEMGAHAYGALRSALAAERRWPHLDDELRALEA